MNRDELITGLTHIAEALEANPEDVKITWACMQHLFEIIKNLTSEGVRA